jgi:hypothetical protein
LDDDGGLTVINLQKGQSQKVNHNKSIACGNISIEFPNKKATFAKDRKHIAALNKDDTLLIIRIQNLAIVRSEDVDLDSDMMEFTSIQQLKPDLWAISGNYIEGDTTEDYPRRMNLIKGDLITKLLSASEVLSIGNLFMGIECEEDSPFYFKFEYLEQRYLLSF